VKITGASNDFSSERVERQQLSGLPVCDPVEEEEEGGRGIEGMVSIGIQDVASTMPAAPKDEKDGKQMENFVDSPLVVSTAPYFNELNNPHTNDAELLDFLMDTLDGEFDPNMLV